MLVFLEGRHLVSHAQILTSGQRLPSFGRIRVCKDSRRIWVKMGPSLFKCLFFLSLARSLAFYPFSQFSFYFVDPLVNG
jgi:hypothetical protein